MEDVIDLGGAIVVVWDGKRYDQNSDGATQDIALTFQSYTSASQRKETSRKTKRGLHGLQAAGVKLGPPPKFREKEIAQMKDLHERGLGLTSIGKVVRVARKDGSWVNTSPRVVSQVVAGEYMSRESWERHNQIARLRLAEGSEAPPGPVPPSS